MAYNLKLNSIQPLGTPAADDLSGAAVHSFSYLVQSPISVLRILATVTTATVGAGTITFRKRPTPGSATGQSTLGTLTVPGSSTVGQVIYKEITPVDCDPGCQIIFEVTSAATSGEAVYGFESCERSEVPDNVSAMVESA